ncbi:cilia- and flagella-associated protein 144 isoform X3 [Alligator mississippiensis]|uniref:cilia- and flagella-associated protein 144 isoform X3 n=1 Tax=Alligator mississippiensis TaxID=8496 RepID=UPI0028778182|nr:cilia- and flagella-associated protein 144 isoform X3 [Alligator mississippiensis]
MARLHERFGLAPRWERAGSGAGGAQCSAAGPAPAAPAVPGKPLSRHDAAEQPADAKFLNLIHHAALEPIKKYSEPQTESQEIGWTTTPLVRQWPVRRGQARAVGPTFKRSAWTALTAGSTSHARRARSPSTWKPHGA